MACHSQSSKGCFVSACVHFAITGIQDISTNRNALPDSLLVSRTKPYTPRADFRLCRLLETAHRNETTRIRYSTQMDTGEIYFLMLVEFICSSLRNKPNPSIHPTVPPPLHPPPPLPPLLPPLPLRLTHLLSISQICQHQLQLLQPPQQQP